MNDFEKNVFINCPFDATYLPLLKATLYTIKAIGLNPRISLERFDSGEVRLKKIKELIESSMYGIHDLSRAKSEKKGEYFRLNMPFELGLDLGVRDYHRNTKFRNKKILILEGEKYSTQKSLSDMSFGDCKCHKGEAEEIIYEIRNWFSELGFKKLKPPSLIWDNYNIFHFNLFEEKKEEGFKQKDIDRLPIKEFMAYIDERV